MRAKNLTNYFGKFLIILLTCIAISIVLFFLEKVIPYISIAVMLISAMVMIEVIRKIPVIDKIKNGKFRPLFSIIIFLTTLSIVIQNYVSADEGGLIVAGAINMIIIIFSFFAASEYDSY